ncbi:hypothetical protein Tco_0253794, partial [Tanacetum coccineum]
MGDEHLCTFSAEEIVPISRESEDTSRSDSKNVLPSRDDSVTFSNPLFEFDVNFNSSDINPLFEFDVNFNSSDINPLFDEVLEDIECKDSYDSCYHDLPLRTRIRRLGKMEKKSIHIIREKKREKR